MIDTSKAAYKSRQFLQSFVSRALVVDPVDMLQDQAQDQVGLQDQAAVNQNQAKRARGRTPKATGVHVVAAPQPEQSHSIST